MNKSDILLGFKHKSSFVTIKVVKNEELEAPTEIIVNMQCLNGIWKKNKIFNIL